MKRYIGPLVFGLCIFTRAWSSELISNDKIYISSESILIGNNGIFAKIDDNIVQSIAIFSDENGIYILKDHISWICKNGHYISPAQGNKCPKCGDERRQNW